MLLFKRFHYTSFHKPMFRRIIAAAMVTSLILANAGCDYLGFYTRKLHWGAVHDYQPSMKVFKRIAPEDSLLLGGRIIKTEVNDKPLLLVAVSNKYRKNEVVALQTLGVPADFYALFLPHGDYDLYVFADLDGNRSFRRNELIGRTPPGAPVAVTPEMSKDGAVVEGPMIVVDFNQPGTARFRLRVKVRKASYVYASLDDKFFHPRLGTAGLYNPAGWMARVQGLLFGLEEYDAGKTMVLFVHGVTGTPRDFKFFVDSLDRSRYQPFFFYYPSGLPLDKLSAVLAQTISFLDKSSRNNRHGIVLVAHSMGGLISLSAIQKLAAEGLPRSLKMFVSASSPYGGNKSAQTWQDSAPAFVASWRDMAKDSPFLRQLVGQPFPEDLPFYLFYSYNDPSTLKRHEGNDGVVTVRSQLEPGIKEKASNVYGFNDTHAGILKSIRAREKLLQLLDEVMSEHRPAAGPGNTGS